MISLCMLCEDKSPNLLLSYDVKVALWIEHTPAFEQEVHVHSPKFCIP